MSDSTTPAYNFGAPFQRKIAALIMCDKTFLPSYRTAVDPKFFSSPVHYMIVTAICKLFDSTSAVPTFESLYEEINGDREISQDQKSAAFAEMDELRTVDLSDSPVVVAKTVEFGRRQAMTVALIQSSDMLALGDIEGIDALIAEASMVGTDMESLGTFYISEMDSRSEKAISDVVVPTMFRGVDRALRGGLHGGQIGAVAGPMKRGKSMVLQNICAVTASLGKVPYYYSFELSEPFVQERLDARLTGIPMDLVGQHWDKVRAKLETIRGRRGEIVIKGAPAYSYSARKIEEHVKLVHRTRGLWPDMIIVDYLDIMESWGSTAYEVYDKQGVAVAELRSLAQKWDIPVWTAIQTSSASLNAESVDESHLSESKKKGHALDFLMTISQTKEERAENLLRLSVVLNRIGRAQFDVPCRIDYTRSYIHECMPTEAA